MMGQILTPRGPPENGGQRTPLAPGGGPRYLLERMGLLDRLRPQPGWRDPDPQLRRAAVQQLADPSSLAEIAATDPDAGVREAATSALLGLALEGGDEPAGLAALAALSDPKHLVLVARSAVHESVSRAALMRLTGTQSFGSVARHGRHATVRLQALRQIPDPAELLTVALKSPHEDAAVGALERLGGEAAAQTCDLESLASVARHAKNRSAARRARAMLRERDEAASGAAPARPETDRRRQTDLCEKVEALARSQDCEPLAAQLAAAQEAWTDLIPDIDDDLAERFTAAGRAARERHKLNQAEREERQAREQERAEFVAQHLAPRIVLCELLESAEGEEAPRRLEDALWEWDRLASPDSPEVRILTKRFEEACRSCRERHEEWQREQAAASLKAQEAAAREGRAREQEERARQARDNSARLQKLCERVGRLLRSETLTLHKAEPALREVRAALDDTPPLPSKRERDALVKRLKAAHAALAPRVKDLRDSEAWKRWANANVQEELCARAEALLETSDAPEAGRRLADLQKRWRNASAASKDKSQELWARFKAAQDRIHSRLEAYHAEQASRKLALCEQVETLSTSSDWVRTTEAIKRLQAEWKTIGPAERADQKALWERFRGACDRFFTRRKEDLARRKDAWTKNLDAKEKLCVQVEALADATAWEKTAAEIRRLQAEWKTIGPVRRNRSEAIWLRFRGACDRFFERYKRRDQIDLEISLVEKEALCRDLEAMIPPVDPSSATVPLEGLLETLRSLLSRWRSGRPLTRDRGGDLAERFDQALDRLVKAFPESVGGTDLDADQNRRRMEELCTRVERLLPAGPASDQSAASPAARLAAVWVEAMAANTIGGKVAEEARWRAAAEDVKRAQAAWQRIGYVPERTRRILSDRFQRACSRVLDRRDRTRGAPTQKSIASRPR